LCSGDFTLKDCDARERKSKMNIDALKALVESDSRQSLLKIMTKIQASHMHNPCPSNIPIFQNF
jgi:hypothetical protein